MYLPIAVKVFLIKGTNNRANLQINGELSRITASAWGIDTGLKFIFYMRTSVTLEVNFGTDNQQRSLNYLTLS